MASARSAVRQATIGDLEALTPLLDAYRQFYGQAPDLDGARAYLHERFKLRESIIFVSEADGQLLGFAQLFPAFSSVMMARTLMLNDLYVTERARGHGVARSLLEAARSYGKDTGAARLQLITAHENHRAQALYEAAGWVADTKFKTYNFMLR